jgi:hypothetical protein
MQNFSVGAKLSSRKIKLPVIRITQWCYKKNNLFRDVDFIWNSQTIITSNFLLLSSMTAVSSTQTQNQLLKRRFVKSERSAIRIVLVHGGFADGSGWEAVYQILKNDGYNVESVSGLIKDPPSGALVPPILPPQDGFLFLDKSKFAESFAADVNEEKAAFMADSQVPWGIEALNGAISEPAWKTKPSWHLVAADDRMIPPPAQRQMAERASAMVVEVAGSHAVYVSQPEAVAKLIKEAAKGVKAATN